MKLSVYTAPTVEPVTLQELKNQARIDDNTDDSGLALYIKTARETYELMTRRALCTRTYELTLDNWPGGRRIRLPHPPLASVTSISYTDEDGAVATIDSGDYLVSTVTEPGEIVLRNGVSWPAVVLQEVDAITIRYVAGYGGADDVPAGHRLAIRLLAAHYYENREATGIGNVSEIPLGLAYLRDIDRAGWF